jgi:Holliday junction resolvase RusA-like endonuclease
MADCSLTLPWSCLAHDNHRLTPRFHGKGLITAPKYREAKANAITLLAALWKGGPLIGPVEVRGVAYFPDKRKRDAGNYRKLITDALSGIAYADDQQIHREVWERGPIDRENPRMELTVTLLRREAA